MKNNIILIILILSVLLNVTLIGYVLFGNYSDKQVISVTKDYPYLSPRAFIKDSNDILINFNPLRQALRSYILSSDKKMQLYFEYLPSGSSIGVNDQENFLAASLFKVPVVMAIMKNVSEGKLDKNKMLTIEEKHINKDFGNLWKRGVGAKLTVAKVVKLSLIESDNTAVNLLIDALSLESMADVLNTLDFPKQSESEAETKVSVKNYSTILKALYLSSYLPHKESNEILDLLAKTEFKNRLESGLPENTKFSHKIGEYEVSDRKNTVYSDCGIVYVPKRPYLICMAVEDESEQTAELLMKAVSQTIYAYVQDL